MTQEELNSISAEVVDAAMLIHRGIGPGLLESVYEVVLAHKLKQRGLDIRRQVPVPVSFRGITFDEGYRLDLLVQDSVIVEIKSVETVTGVHKKQFLTYLRLMNKPLGLLLNSNAELMKNGISPIANNLPEN